MIMKHDNQIFSFGFLQLKHGIDQELNSAVCETKFYE
jgi:hypothetical protein